ncbi:hypothetical protein J1605_007413 [Eschrichtius robustus]|uniref:MYCBP-associated protein n=1 Tax=Eschrichtius robustus TaxID=9764 RepID=A0AB34H0N7_ESCRO|nr:hypothetical protein J1605_007413 [Eschrichtius robustus]
MQAVVRSRGHRETAERVTEPLLASSVSLPHPPVDSPPPGSAPPAWLLTCRRPPAPPVTSPVSGAFSGSAPEERLAAGGWARQDEKGGFQAVSAQVVRWVRAPARGAGCYGRPGGLWRAGARAQGRGSCRTARFFRVPAAQGHAHSRGGTMKSLKKESRLRIPTNRFLEAPESVKEKKRAKVPEQPTPPIQEEPEPVSNVLKGDDILALAIKKEDLRKQHIPRLIETEDKPVITQKLIIRKLKPKDHRKKVCHLVAHPATPDAATKPLDYSGPGDILHGSDQILPHHILGSLQDFKRIAVARGNTQLAELIHTPPCLMTLISAKEEPKQEAPEEEKAHPPWAPPLQHNFLKNWQRNIALRKKQQETLSERLKKPVGELLMHTGETYRKIQEERELLDRTLPTRPDGKGCELTTGFWSRLEYLGDEMMGLVMTKTKTQRGLVEPITHIGKPCSIQVEMGLPAQKDAWYRYTWDRSLFLTYRRKELQSIMAELDFSQQSANLSFLCLSEDIDGLEVVGKGRPFSTVTVEDYSVFERSQESSSEDTVHLDVLGNYPDVVPMPILGPSLLFCGKPACWLRGSNPEDKRHVGIAVRLTFETLEGEKASSELTVVNNGTVAIWYDWRRRSQLDSFQDLKRNRMQQFYFNNREGVILPGETRNFAFFFKSLNAGIFRECWEFGTHPTLLGGALLQVNLHAVSLTQDIFRDERKLLENKLASHEAVTIVESMLQELLRGILTPERAQSPVDAYLTEEDLFHHRNPRLHYQHQVVQNLHRLWCQYTILPPKAEEARPGEEEHLSPRAQAAAAPSAYWEEASMKVESSAHLKSPALDPRPPRQESEALRDSRDPVGSQKSGPGSQRKSIMEEILVEGSPDLESVRSSRELDGLPPPEWNLCLEDFRKVPPQPLGVLVEKGPGIARCRCFWPELPQQPLPPPGAEKQPSEGPEKAISWSSLFILGA